MLISTNHLIFLVVYIAFELVLLILSIKGLVYTKNSEIVNNSGINGIDLLLILNKLNQFQFTPRIEKEFEGVFFDRQTKTIFLNSTFARTPIISNICKIFIELFDSNFSISKILYSIRTLYFLFKVYLLITFILGYTNYLPLFLIAMLNLIILTNRNKIVKQIIDITIKQNISEKDQLVYYKEYLKHWTFLSFSPF